MELVTERLPETGPLFREFYKWGAFAPSSSSRVRCSQCASMVNVMLTECASEVMMKTSSALSVFSLTKAHCELHSCSGQELEDPRVREGDVGRRVSQWKSTLLDNHRRTGRSRRSHAKAPRHTRTQGDGQK